MLKLYSAVIFLETNINSLSASNLVLIIVLVMIVIFLINTILSRKQLLNKIDLLQDKSQSLNKQLNKIDESGKKLQQEKFELIAENKQTEKLLAEFQYLGTQLSSFVSNNTLQLGAIKGISPDAKILLLNLGLLNTLEADQASITEKEILLSDLIKQVILNWWPNIDASRFELDGINVKEALKFDAELLAVCLINLLDNALKFSAAEEKISIEAEQENEDKIKITIKNPGGLAKKHHSAVFNKFFKLSNDQNKGAGLGLYVCKLAIEKMKGTIGVQSRPDEIVEFWMEFPNGERLKKRLNP